ncbi:MAG TPA: LysR family transcriptional regulator [Oligoflexia bacterium]|nr:LysR family transcriptional regulator [Oligoflexia bacterium]HMR24617.1 LysR family transcriptional regulator [Oligoflexia bacterium]
MDWLNYHHLYYFWQVAKCGSISKATEELRLAQPTISAQLKQLENNLGHKLFIKDGRALKLSEMGRIVYAYAQDIFSIGHDLKNTLKNLNHQGTHDLNIGITMMIPKLLSYKLINKLFNSNKKIVPHCFEDNLSSLLERLTLHEVDVVLSDAPVPPLLNIKAYNHFLGESPISFCVAQAMVEKLNGPFPHCLDQFPFILPTKDTSLRQSLLLWFEKNNIHPNFVAEIQDSALMKMLGQEGHGIFAIPSSIEQDVVKNYNTKVIGKTTAVKESIYAITIKRKIQNPALSQFLINAQYVF